jgi:hypothetical protein
MMSLSGRPAGVAVYDLTAGATISVSDDETYVVRWLSDSKRAVFFSNGGTKLTLIDTETKKRSTVDVRLPGPASIEVFAVAPDDRMIYYGASRSEADIWLVERK